MSMQWIECPNCHIPTSTMICSRCNGTGQIYVSMNFPPIAVPNSPHPAQPWIAPSPGCICPPGANKECEAPACPRKNYLNMSGASTK